MSISKPWSYLLIILSFALLPVVWLGYLLLSILATIYFSLSILIQLVKELFWVTPEPARTYEEWRARQVKLDSARRVQSWARIDISDAYDWRGLQDFKEELETTRQQGDMADLCGHLRSQATRNCCSLLSPSLYLNSQIQTKHLIQDYIHEVRRCIDRLLRKDSLSRPSSAFLEQEKHRVIGDVRQALGRTTLVLQGGAMLSLCHFGVVRALFRRKLLPRIITATGTGAIAAALVGCTPDSELLFAMKGATININAFVQAKEQRNDDDTKLSSLSSWLRALLRRTQRFFYTGHFFEIATLAQCVRDNIGDITFEEAYVKSGRILNITIAKADVEGTPQLLNHITTPHVVVWSAVAASVATSKRMFAAATLKCKNDVGVIDRYFAVDYSKSQAKRYIPRRQMPLERIGELFDVNHYIVSQTRPYIVPFVRLQDILVHDTILGAISRVVYCEFLHRLDTLSRLGLLPRFIQRIVIDELIPSTASWSKFVIAPELSPWDYLKIFNFPTPKTIDEWALKGERSVWPKLCQIKIRCCVEFDIDAAYRREMDRLRSAQPYASQGNGHS